MSRSLLTSTPMSMALSAEDGEDAHTRQKRRRMEGAESVGGVVDAVAVASAAPPPPLPPPPPLLSRVGLRERHRSLAVRAERGLWRSFPTQAEALAFLQQAEGEDAEAAAVVGGAALRLWSVEYPPRMQWEVSGGGAAGSASGARRFVVSSYTTFYARYMTTPARERHHYEVIREGRRQRTPHTTAPPPPALTDTQPYPSLMCTLCPPLLCCACAWQRVTSTLTSTAAWRSTPHWRRRRGRKTSAAPHSSTAARAAEHRAQSCCMTGDEGAVLSVASPSCPPPSVLLSLLALLLCVR